MNIYDTNTRFNDPFIMNTRYTHNIKNRREKQYKVGMCCCFLCFNSLSFLLGYLSHESINSITNSTSFV